MTLGPEELALCARLGLVVDTGLCFRLTSVGVGLLGNQQPESVIERARRAFESRTLFSQDESCAPWAYRHSVVVVDEVLMFSCEARSEVCDDCRKEVLRSVW